MSNTAKLTSTKTKISYIFIYIIYDLAYFASPLFIMCFIDAVVEANKNCMIIFACLAFADFIAVQFIGYLMSIFVGKIKAENASKFYQELNRIISSNDLKEEEITQAKLSQYIGEYYEKANRYFFLEKVELVFSIASIVVIFAIMFVIDWRLSLLLLFFVPLSFWVSKLYEKKLYKNANANKQNSDNIKSYLMDQNVLTKEERFSDKKQMPPFNGLINIFLRDYRKSVRTNSCYLYFFSYAFLNFAILIVILLSGYLTSVNLLTIGALFAFQNYTSQLWTPGEYLMSYSSDYQEAKPAIEEIEHILSLKKAKFCHDKIKYISLKGFTSLDMEGKPLFIPIDLEFKKGNIYLIKGINGIGKTTMIEAIMGFNNRYKGKIDINGSSSTSFDDFCYVAASSYISRFYSEEAFKGSSGQKKLSQLKLYLDNIKSVYILDEPTNFVDEENKKDVIGLIKAKSNSENIMIIISHDSIFDEVANEIIELREINATEADF